ncbi:MAG: sulfatase, partial [Planctomycetaceae bacterium]
MVGRIGMSAVVLVGLLAGNLGAAEQRLNVILLLADDLGWTGLRCFGSDLYETPHLDQLAATGMRFTDSYSACTVCSPTRASIMTGMYPARVHLTDFIAGQNRPWARLKIPDWTPGLKQHYVTIAAALQQAGYATAHVGKWHLSFPRGTARDMSGPEQHGFDVSYVKPQGTRGYRLPSGFNRKGESGSDYLTDYLTDQALAVIDRHQDRPFFLYFAYHTPHTPIQGRSDLVGAFRSKVREQAVHKNPEYAAMVASLDQSVGRILQRLERRGMSDRTVVIFTSDNGGLTQRFGRHDGFTDNLPLRRGKGSAFEGGVRVPTIVHWPGVTRPGTVCRVPVISIDYYPTILEMAGATGDLQHNTRVDGRSLVPLLKDPATASNRSLFWHYPHYHAGGDSPYSAVRSGNWKLIEFHEGPELALFDLSRDPGESQNLARQLPRQAAKLRERLREWQRKVGAQMTSQNPDYDPAQADKVRRAPRSRDKG